MRQSLLAFMIPLKMRAKLSDAIIESANLKAKARYSKAIHTPRLIQTIDPAMVSQKCPLFRELYRYLSEFCREETL
jgi:hypothetical protein